MTGLRDIPVRKTDSNREERGEQIMGAELEFRTAVGGYKKDDVLEYVENMNDKLDQMTRAHEEETKGYQNRIKELEELLKQEEENSAALAEDQDKRLEGLAKENSRLHD